METVIYLEVLDRFGRVKERIQLDDRPLTIGRTYANDVVIDDHFVSPYHAGIERLSNGRYLLVDLNSLNGVRGVRPNRVIKEEEIKPGMRVRIGHTVLRFRDSDYGSTEAVKDQFGQHSYGRFISHPAVSLCLLAVAALVFLTDRYFNSFERIDILGLMNEHIAILVALIVWLLAWAIASRVVTHGFYFLTHLGIASMGASVLLVIAIVSPFFAFGFAKDEWSGTMQVAGAMLGVFIALFLHLSVMFARYKKTVMATAISFAVVSVLSFQLYTSNKQEPVAFTAIDMQATVKPLEYKLVNSNSPVQFLKSAITKTQGQGVQTENRGSAESAE